MFDKRISIFTGHFGSGKTEVAVNYAMELHKLYAKTAIVDLDIVNPFFRTADAAETLRKQGIKVVLPMYANTNVDVPSLPPEINMLFEEKAYRVVLDIGGDDLGARVVSRYRNEITADEFALFFVVNVNRPMTDSRQKIKEMVRDIEASANIKITGLVNNSNLLADTTPGDVLRGQKLIEQVSQELDVPIAFTSGFEESLLGLQGEIGNPLFILSKNIRLPWD